MGIPYIQLIQYENIDGTQTISGLVTQFTASGWIEGINNKIHKHYHYSMVFEERGRPPLEFEIRSNVNIHVDLPKLITINYAYRKYDDDEVTAYLISYSISKIRRFNTPLRVKEPDFFSGF